MEQTMTQQHTPGPWRDVFCESEPREHHIYGHNEIAPHALVGGYGPARDAADARLIAAAPDLLAALQVLTARDDAGYCKVCGMYGDHLGICDVPQAEAAIRKATGDA